MNTTGYDTLTLAGRHVPDENSGPFDNMQQAQAAGYDVLTPVTGMYEIGAVIDGQFVPIISEKASLIFDRVAAAKQAQDAAQASAPPAPTTPEPQPEQTQDAAQASAPPAPTTPEPQPEQTTEQTPPSVS